MSAMTSTNTDLAAEIIIAARQYRPGSEAQALADAGLLVTDEIQAILDALNDDRSSFRYSEPINVPLAAAIRAYLASRAT